MTKRNTNNAIDDEFGFNYDMNEDDYNKLRVKEQKKSMPQPQKKRKKKEKFEYFRGLGDRDAWS